MVMFALIPYLALSAALQPLTPIIAKQLHTSLQTMSLSSGLANAAYAAGTVMAVQFAQHLPQRRMLILYATLLVIGSVLAASAQDPGMYIVGHVIQGLCTSLLLISAVPPLAIGYPASKLRTTAVIMNMCIFGAVALGPAIGGLQAHFDAWRPLFWIIAAIAASALVLSVLTFDDAPPADPDSPRDPLAIALAAIGCAAAFFGASELLTHSFLDPITIVPLLGGLAVIVVLIVYQFRAKRPLLTIRTMLTSTMPVAGIVVALFAAAASVSATALTAAVLSEHYAPLHVGLLYLPEVAGAVITAVLLGVVITRRAMHYLPLGGMIFLAAGIGVFLIEVPPSEAATLVGSGLTGIGLGATVAPALFVAGFSLPSASLQRVFAIVELMRAVAAFMIAPIFAHLAVTVGGSLDAGTSIALWIGLGLALGGAALGVAIYALGGARPQAPDLERFVAGDSPAWYSPPLLARLRPGLATTTTQPATESAN
jgi:MFS family permease